MVLRKKVIDAYLSLSHLFHQILRFCVQDQNGGKLAKNRPCIKTQFWLSLAKNWVQEGRQMKGNHASLILLLKQWFWMLEAVSTPLLVGPVVRCENYAGEAWMALADHPEVVEAAQDLHFYRARWTGFKSFTFQQVSSFYFYSGISTLKSHYFSLSMIHQLKTDE